MLNIINDCEHSFTLIGGHLVKQFVSNLLFYCICGEASRFLEYGECEPKTETQGLRKMSKSLLSNLIIRRKQTLNLDDFAPTSYSPNPPLICAQLLHVATVAISNTPSCYRFIKFFVFFKDRTSILWHVTIKRAKRLFFCF